MTKLHLLCTMPACVLDMYLPTSTVTTTLWVALLHNNRDV